MGDQYKQKQMECLRTVEGKSNTSSPGRREDRSTGVRWRELSSVFERNEVMKIRGNRRVIDGEAAIEIP